MDKVKKVIETPKNDELKERTASFIKEINDIQDKYNLALVAKLKYTEGGIVPEIGIADTKVEEKVADKIK